MSESNNIELISVTFAAGESRLFAMAGNYFEIIDAPGAIDVILSSFNGEQRARMAKAAASFYSKGVDFGVIQITSASAQTIRFAYGSGETGTRRATGSVTISGAIALDAATLAALEQINVRPESSSGNWNSTATPTAGTPITVFTPASNTAGVILQAATIQEIQSASGSLVLIAKNSAPASITDGEVIFTATNYTSVGASAYQGSDLKMPQHIAAGLGLYYITTGTSSASGLVKMARWKNL